MENKQTVTVIGAGLAGSEAAWQIAQAGYPVRLFEMKPQKFSPAHKSAGFAELICSNSLKAARIDSAAGLLKEEMRRMDSLLVACADKTAVPAGGALAVDRDRFSELVTKAITEHPNIEVMHGEVTEIPAEGVTVIASGPLTSDTLAEQITNLCGGALSFFDAAAPIVTRESLDMEHCFTASRYDKGDDDYINCPMNKEEYDAFYEALITAERAPIHDFDVMNPKVYEGCMPIEVMAQRGHDTIRFGPLKPVGLRDPRTGHRPWAVVQLRTENAEKTLFNLVGFQTNLKFPEQKRVFGMIPGLKNAEYMRYGVMHRNTFLDAPRLLDANLLFAEPSRALGVPVHVAGQLAGTEGYCEAIRAGLHAAIAVAAELRGATAPKLPCDTAYGALLAYATDPATVDYQPSHVNFGILAPFEPQIRNKRERYAAYAERGARALAGYLDDLAEAGLALPGRDGGR